MNKEELLQKIKDEVAREYDWKDYEEACRYVTYDEKGNYVPVIMRYVNLCDEIANRYAIAMCEAQKKECAEKISDLDVDALKTVLTTKNVAE